MNFIFIQNHGRLFSPGSLIIGIEYKMMTSNGKTNDIENVNALRSHFILLPSLSWRAKKGTLETSISSLTKEKDEHQQELVYTPFKLTVGSDQSSNTK